MSNITMTIEDILAAKTNLTEEQKAEIRDRWGKLRPEAQATVLAIFAEENNPDITEEELNEASILLAKDPNNWKLPQFDKFRKIAENILFKTIFSNLYNNIPTAKPAGDEGRASPARRDNDKD